MSGHAVACPTEARWLILGAGFDALSEKSAAGGRIHGLVHENPGAPAWRVERAFRETKSTLEVRPVFHHHHHHRDDTTIGHIVGCFLALRLEVDLQRRLDERGVDVAWPDLMRDLREVRAVEITLDDHRYRLRIELKGHAAAAFAAAGVRAPRVCEHLARV